MAKKKKEMEKKTGSSNVDFGTDFDPFGGVVPAPQPTPTPSYDYGGSPYQPRPTPTLPQSIDPTIGQQPQQQDTGIWNWIKDKYYTAVGGGFDPREEAKITGEPVKGLSAIELLGIGAVGSTGIVGGPFGSQMSLFGSTAKTMYKTAFEKGKALSYKELNFLAYGKYGAKAAVNPKTVATTSSWLVRNIAITVPATLLAISAIGTYPFSGFIKEEALQTLSLGVKSAITNNNIAGAEEALAYQEELLNPDKQRILMEKIPYKNIIENLKEFFRAARIKANIDRALIEDMKSGKGPADIYAQRKKEEFNMDKELADYYNELALQRIELEKKARREGDLAAIEYWTEYKKEMMKLEEEERERIKEFWLNYWKEKMSLQASGGRSTLGFGLLR